MATNGAQALIRTLVDGGVTTCFTNPGTSEMHFVAALDSVPEMRGVLALFEGVATGAADGYARMSGKPAATLLHLGSGLGNGVANLHNARRAGVPMVNIVGDHATYHKRFDAPLQSDIETVARNVSPGWVRTTASTAEIGRDGAEAIAAAIGPPAQIATLILPADVSWSDGATPGVVAPAAAPVAASSDAVAAAAAALRGGGGRVAIVLGGRALRREALVAAAGIAAATGAKLLGEVFPTRLERGAGLPPLERIAYLPELAGVQLRGLSHLILVDAKAPVSFFAYPGKQSELTPKGCEVVALCDASQDVGGTLAALADAVGSAGPALAQAGRPSAPEAGPLTAEAVCRAVGATLPEGAIISDESQTSGVTLAGMTAGAPAHDVLALTGGAIGQGLPVAVGAAVACPDRPVLALDGDGSAMYTIQALWTMAREGLNVTSVIFNNRSYGILNLELERVGARGAGPRAKAQLDLSDVGLDFVSIAQGMGVPAARAETAEGFTAALARAFAEPGPHLIEAVVPPVYSGWQLKAIPRALGALSHLPAPVASAVKRRVYP